MKDVSAQTSSSDLVAKDAAKSGIPVSSASLTEASASVAIPTGGPRWRRFLAFAGPGFLISVGYMDPGNWGTDISAGAKYAYGLLWVVLLSSLLAMFLQTLCARLGIAAGKDLAQCCRDYYPKWVSMPLWALAEVAIIACDLAEVIGSAVALKLLFGLPLIWGVALTSLDVLMLIGLMHVGFRKLEAVVLTLIGTIALCFLIEVFLAKPDWGPLLIGTFKPNLFGREGLLLSLGILGATVMPHNLYLHSSIVMTRAHATDEPGKRQAIRYNTADTLIALGAAFFINAAILVVGAATFHRAGQYDVQELEDAHRMLVPLLGGGAAAAFAIGLLASGQSSTITGTLAGQVVMEGFLHWRIRPWIRRLITRGLAIVPAAILVAGSGGAGTVKLIVLSQVVLSMQLPFAIFPLIAFTSDRARMGPFASSKTWKGIGYAVGAVITVLNVYLLLPIISHG